MHEIETLTSAMWAGLGAIGGAAKVTVKLLGLKTLPTNMQIFWMFLANMFVSGFAGYMGAVIATTLTTNDDMHVIAAGISGYMGVAALDMFSDWYEKRFSKKD